MCEYWLQEIKNAWNPYQATQIYLEIYFLQMMQELGKKIPGLQSVFEKDIFKYNFLLDSELTFLLTAQL